MSANTDPFGAFFSYAARRWDYHLHSAPVVSFNLDDVLELASLTSARYRAWALESGHWHYWACQNPLTGLLDFLARCGNASMLEQLLDRLALNGDVDRRFTVHAARVAIGERNLDNFRTLMNHQSTAKATKTVEMLQIFTDFWIFRGSDNLKEWTKLITGLFDMLVTSDTIPSPNRLLTTACNNGCMPIIEKLFERGKVDSAFQEQLLQPTDGRGSLGTAVARSDVKMLRYLCQQHGIEAHASNRDTCGSNILAYCSSDPKVEIIELLLDNFSWLVSERGGDDQALFGIIANASIKSEGVESTKLLLHHTQATPGLVDVDELLASAARRGWPDMCRMLIVDGHADAQTVVKRSSSGRLELKKNCLERRRPEKYRGPDEKVLEAIAGCLPYEVLRG